MYPKSFEYISPTNIDDVISLLDKYKEDAKLISGGHSLIPLMKLRLVSPQIIVDLNNVSGYDNIALNQDILSIGSRVTHHEIEISNLLKEKCYMIPEAATLIGDPQVRNVGTIGGALAQADPAGDWGSVMLSLNAEFAVKGKNGDRSIKAIDFFKDYFETDLTYDEILTEINIKVPDKSQGGAYLKLERKIGDFATVGIAVHLSVKKNHIDRIGIGLTAVSNTPIKAIKSEEFLLNKQITDENIIETANITAQNSDPSADLRGSVEYKKAMVKEFTIRAIKLAIKRCKGD